MVGRGGFFALSFGSIVGSGWIVLLGEWLKLAAPGGALLALLAGGMLMAAIGLCYAELVARMPHAGAELRYVADTLGPKAAFPVGWFLTLFLVAMCAFEGTALPWLLGLLLPVHATSLYRFLGEPVSGWGLSVGCLGAAAICALNLGGVRVSVLFQRVITYAFLAVMVSLIIAGLKFGRLENLQPAFSPPGGKSWLLGFTWLFGTCAMLLYGFQSALYLIEERAPHVSVRAATGSMVIGIVAAALFYAAVLLSAGSIIPWRGILTAELPSVAAFDALLPGRIAPVILVVAICSLAKTWNAVIMMASRLVLAQARAGLLPAWLGRIDARRKTPRNALLLVTGASMIGIFLGRGAIVPIVNMATICVSMTIALMLAVLIVQRRRQPRSPGFSVPAPRLLIPVCAVGAVLMAGFALFQPLWVQSGIPLEWKLIALWSLLGFKFRLLVRR